MLSAYRLSCLRSQQVLFSELDFKLAPAEILHIVGPNGCGKSSLLQIVLGLHLPQAGEVRWQGLPITDADSDYRGCLVYLGHKSAIKNSLTVLENLQMARKLGQYTAIPLDWSSILHRVGLQDLQSTQCAYLSAGQRQRVALTRLLLTDAVLWILDEPFTSLDSQASFLLQSLLMEHQQRGGMTIFTSHHAFDLANSPVKQLSLAKD